VIVWRVDGEPTVPHPRQITLPDAVSSSIFVGPGHVGQVYDIMSAKGNERWGWSWFATLDFQVGEGV
jgi:hypothetical protein